MSDKFRYAVLVDVCDCADWETTEVFDTFKEAKDEADTTFANDSNTPVIIHKFREVYSLRKLPAEPE